MSRDVREIVRDEPLVRDRILDLLRAGPLTVPEVAVGLACPPEEAMYWMMGMRKYGYVAELAGPTDEGYFRYEAVRRA
jgi:hypothetical protein